jgi:hypothetical protein
MAIKLSLYILGSHQSRTVDMHEGREEDDAKAINAREQTLSGI